MLEQNEIQRLERYLKGKANENDLKWIEDFFSHGHGNQNLKSHLSSDWDEILQDSHPENAKLKDILERIHVQIREKELSKKKKLIFRIADSYKKIAAILLLPIIVAGTLFFALNDFSNTVNDQITSTTLVAPMGARVSFDLPDGTKGWLNSGSSLTYSIPFTKDRQVLLKGEAWFEVFHNEKSPFEINAGESKVKVLGTSFNINAYPDENFLAVSLQNGKVEFSNKTFANKVILKPSEQLVLQNSEIKIQTVDVSKYKAWTEGRLVFRGDNMLDVARQIEHWYNVKVEIVDQELNQFSFRATFEDERLEEVLNQLSLTSPIEFKIIKPKKLPNDVIQKVKVRIFKKTK